MVCFMNNLTQRVMTATVLITAVVLLLFKASLIVFAGVVYLCGILAIWELWRLIQPNNKISLVLMMSSYSAAAALLQFYALTDFLWIIGFGHSLLTLYLLYYQPKLQTMLVAIYGSILLAVVVYSMVILQAFGSWVLLSAMCLVWLTDAGGYFIGKSLGKKLFKLDFSPNISPKKSWEGAIGGAFIATISTVLALYFSLDTWLLRSANPNNLQVAFPTDFVWQLIILLLPLVLAAYSITGDLVESLLKRQAGVKDSSQLLPGHGGILDRIDALIPVLPLCAAWVIYLESVSVY
jgi:phosphatidate cytidylyltransferase